MKEKIAIMTIIFLFFISTTGLPVFSHYCKDMGKSISPEGIDCLNIEQFTESCCLGSIAENNEKIKSEKTECCVNEFDYRKIEDNFSQSSITVLLSVSLIIAENNLTTIQSEAEKKYSQNSNYNLPPPKFGKELLNTIHQLKLDLPVC